MPSGYFSVPSKTLDPDLFDGEDLKDSVRTGLLNLLYDDLEKDVEFREPWHWTYAWLAGSGASYQWAADRGNGDLDVLFGVDLPQFLEDNPQFPRLSEREVAVYTDKVLRTVSWPKTRHVSIGGSQKKYEITFFWNPGMGMNIESINPYAAYDLLDGSWTVKPPKLPEDPSDLYPREWFDFTDADWDQAIAIDDLARSGGTLGREQARRMANTMWDSIHGGRKAAFSDTGGGYGDFHNFRWQRAKETGTVDLLRKHMGPASETESPMDMITRAAIRYAGPRYTG